MSGRYARRCHVNGCSNNSVSSPDLGFIMVPTPDDLEKRLQWLKLMKRQDIVEHDKKIRLYVCENHFEKSDIMVVNQRKNVINMNVLPRYFLDTGDETASSNTDVESSGSQKRLADANSQVVDKRQRLREMLHTEVDIKEENKGEVEIKEEIKGDVHDKIKKFSDVGEMLVPLPNSPVKLFELICANNEFLRHVIEFTNKEILLRCLTCDKFHEVTYADFRIFIGLLLYTGSFNNEFVGDCWKRNKLFNLDFRRYMVRSRFLTILKYLRFTDSNPTPVKSVRPLLELFNTVMSEIYSPERELVVEEVLWGKCHARMYLLREPCGTVLKIHLEEELRGKPKPLDKVLFDIAKDRLDIGHLIYLEQHQTSCELATKLLARSTFCIGALSKLPPDMKAINNAKLVNIGRWKMDYDEEVAYVTTDSRANTFRVCGKQVRIAHVSDMLEKTKFKVTSFLAQYYPCLDQQMSLQAKIFVHTMMLSLLNAHCLHNKFFVTEMDFDKFRMSVIRGLLLPFGGCNFNKKVEKVVLHRLERISFENVIDDYIERACLNCSRREKRFCNTLYRCLACFGQPSMCIKCFCVIHNS